MPTDPYLESEHQSSSAGTSSTGAIKVTHEEDASYINHPPVEEDTQMYKTKRVRAERIVYKIN